MGKEQNRLYSENNRGVLTSFISMITAFIVVFAGYFFAVNVDNPKADVVFVVKIGVYLVLTLFAVLSISFGYGRRRDHIFACKTEKESIYGEKYSNGLEENFFTFLPDFYLIMTLFFIMTIIIFSLVTPSTCQYNVMHCCCCYYYENIITVLISLFMILIAWILYYTKYKKMVYKMKNDEGDNKTIKK